ncbi:LytR/AlgR family response regulator transcription factor [Wenyingzhuangia sp. IMCC45574]
MKQLKNISCIIVDDESIAREIIATHLSKIDHVTIINSFGNAIDAINFLRNTSVDLIFLDINMPDITGIAFAKAIDPSIKIIFTTAYRDYAVEGFELQAVDYLLKPISFDRILKAITNFSNSQSTLTPQTANDFIFVRSDRKMVKVNFNDINYIESFSDYLKIHLEAQTVVTRETISSIKEKLPPNKFLRIHRSYIIPIHKISSYTNEEIIIHNKSFPISRSYKNEILNKLNSF